MKYINYLFVQEANADEWIDWFDNRRNFAEFLARVADEVDPYGDAEFDGSNFEPWGSADEVSSFERGSYVWHITINRGLPYIGVSRSNR